MAAPALGRRGRRGPSRSRLVPQRVPPGGIQPPAAAARRRPGQNRRPGAAASAGRPLAAHRWPQNPGRDARGPATGLRGDGEQLEQVRGRGVGAAGPRIEDRQVPQHAAQMTWSPTSGHEASVGAQAARRRRGPRPRSGPRRRFAEPVPRNRRAAAVAWAWRASGSAPPVTVLPRSPGSGLPSASASRAPPPASPASNSCPRGHPRRAPLSPIRACRCPAARHDSSSRSGGAARPHWPSGRPGPWCNGPAARPAGLACVVTWRGAPPRRTDASARAGPCAAAAPSSGAGS